MLIKILDEKLANVLRDSGFLYTTETVNGNTKLYCFEESKDIEETIKRITKELGDETFVVIRDYTLSF